MGIYIDFFWLHVCLGWSSASSTSRLSSSCWFLKCSHPGLNFSFCLQSLSLLCQCIFLFVVVLWLHSANEVPIFLTLYFAVFFDFLYDVSVAALKFGYHQHFCSVSLFLVALRMVTVALWVSSLLNPPVLPVPFPSFSYFCLYFFIIPWPSVFSIFSLAFFHLVSDCLYHLDYQLLIWEPLC